MINNNIVKLKRKKEKKKDSLGDDRFTFYPLWTAWQYAKIWWFWNKYAILIYPQTNYTTDRRKEKIYNTLHRHFDQQQMCYFHC